MSALIPGLVETSTNLALIRTTKNSVRIATSQRSSVASELNEIAESVASIFLLGDASVETAMPIRDGSLIWIPHSEVSPIRLPVALWKRSQVKAIHAGLECGIIGERIPGMDMISFGPTLEGAHSPDERIYIDTVEKFWNLLLAILRSVD